MMLSIYALTLLWFEEKLHIPKPKIQVITSKDESCVDLERGEVDLDVVYNAVSDEQLRYLTDNGVYCTQEMEYR